MAAITLLDGGLGQELVHRSGDRPTPLWSTQVMIDHPGLVAEVHADYRRAGATVTTTNSYALHHDRLAGTPFEGDLSRLLGLALAEAAGPGRIAGSIGPLVASYRPDLHPDPITATPLYAEVAARLAPGVDLLLAETVASLDHARAALAGARGAGRPVWLAVTVQDNDGTRLRSGEALTDAAALAEAEGAEAVLVNCAFPEAVTQAMPVLARGRLPFGGYANGFTRISEGFLTARPTVDALAARSDLSPDRYAEFAMGWVAEGATIVGGCCEVGPAHIARLAQALRDAGHEIV